MVADRRWLFPTPGGPKNRTFSNLLTNARGAYSRISLSPMLGWKAKSNSSSVFRKGKWASLVRTSTFRSWRSVTSASNSVLRNDRYVDGVLPATSRWAPGARQLDGVPTLPSEVVLAPVRSCSNLRHLLLYI
jgi:hypothetical protein